MKVRKHPQEKQPAPLLMPAEWTNPHTTHLAAVMVPFSSCLLLLSLTSFSFLILVPAKPTKELAVASVVGNLLPAFQYTHRRTFVHSSAYIFAQSLPFFISQCKQTSTELTGFHIALCPGRRDLKCLKLTLLLGKPRGLE